MKEIKNKNQLFGIRCSVSSIYNFAVVGYDKKSDVYYVQDRYNGYQYTASRSSIKLDPADIKDLKLN